MRGFMRVTTLQSNPNDCLQRRCPDTAVYWRSLLASFAQITFWTGMWEMCDTDLRSACWTKYNMQPIGWDWILIASGFTFLMFTQSFLGASGLSEMPPLVLMTGWRATAYLIVGTGMAMYAQVALGLGIYNMFDVHIAGESAGWNTLCCLIGLVLLTSTRTLAANAGLEPEQERDSKSWKVRGRLYIRAFGGVAGAFILWKGWENLLDLEFGLPPEVWREILYAGFGLLMLFMTRTFLGASGIIATASTAGAANELTTAHASFAAASEGLMESDQPTAAVATAMTASDGAALSSGAAPARAASPDIGTGDKQALLTTTAVAIAHVDVRAHESGANQSAARAIRSGSSPAMADEPLRDDTPHTGSSDVGAAGSPALSTVSLPVPYTENNAPISGNARLHRSAPPPALERSAIYQSRKNILEETCDERWVTVRLVTRASIAYFGVITFWTGIYNIQVDHIPGNWDRNVLYMIFGLIGLGITDTLYANTLIYPSYPKEKRTANANYNREVVSGTATPLSNTDFSALTDGPDQRRAAEAARAAGGVADAVGPRTIQQNLFFGPTLSIRPQPVPASGPLRVDDQFFSPNRVESPAGVAIDGSQPNSGPLPPEPFS